jgi:hypothetical protein
MNIDLAVNAVEGGLFINFLIWKVSIDKSKQRYEEEDRTHKITSREGFAQLDEIESSSSY